MDIPEQNNIEFKSASHGRLPAELWKTISAFSNSEGGTLYLGVNSDGNAIGLTNSELDKIQRDLYSLCSEEFNLKIYPEIRIENNIVVAIFEPIQASFRPVFRKKSGIQGGTYIRIGSSSIKADEEIIKRLIAASRGGVETTEYDYDWRNVFDETLVTEYINYLNNRSENVYQQFSTEEILAKQKAISKDYKKVTLFGLLAFSRNRELQDIVAPTVNIGVTLYAGLEKVNPYNPNETYIDSAEFNGPAYKQYTNALFFIRKYIPVRGVVVNGIRQDIMHIPEIAIREALANAIVHRDYSTHSSRIQVDIYADRIEIINPGNSLVPIEELDTAPSTSRNPLLMSYLKELGVTDQKGRGVRTIVSALKENNLVKPTFEDTGKSFKVTIYSHSEFKESTQMLIDSLDIKNLNSRQIKALAYVIEHEEGINNGVYRDINNMSAVRDDKKANKELAELTELGLLVAKGFGKGRRYELSKENISQ